MPKIITPLSDTSIRQIKPKDKPFHKADGQGLKLLIMPDKRKIWEFVYESPTQFKRRKTTFGTYPTVSLDEARAKREEWQKLIRQGIDPIDNKREEKAEIKLQIESNFINVVDL